MAQSVLYTSKKVWEKIIPVLDQKRYFLLGNQSCSRRDLFNFALALGISEGIPSEVEGKKDFFRNERMEKERPLYDAVFFKEELNCDPDKIDEILNEDDVFTCVQKYAETGFNRIASAMRTVSDSSFTFELINEIDKIYKDFREEYPD